MITEERLNEIEENGRDAMPLRAELRLLCAAYREAISGLKIIDDKDGRWLHFSSLNGKKALVNIDCLVAERGTIVGATISEWANDQHKISTI